MTKSIIFMKQECREEYFSIFQRIGEKTPPYFCRWYTQQEEAYDIFCGKKSDAYLIAYLLSDSIGLTRKQIDQIWKPLTKTKRTFEETICLLNKSNVPVAQYVATMLPNELPKKLSSCHKAACALNRAFSGHSHKNIVIKLPEPILGSDSGWNFIQSIWKSGNLCISTDNYLDHYRFHQLLLSADFIYDSNVDGPITDARRLYERTAHPYTLQLYGKGLVMRSRRKSE